MQYWQTIKKERQLSSILSNYFAVQYWHKKFDKAYNNYVDSWAYRWTFSCWQQNGLSILPEVNLVSNIGFGTNSTHTKDRLNSYSKMTTQKIEFPLLHPPQIMPNTMADTFTQKTQFGLMHRTYRKIKSIFNL
jgi:hypothetical protein